MSRVLDLERWRSTRPRLARDSAQLAERLDAARTSGSQRVRSEEDQRIITRMALVEIARRRDEGRLVQIGPREYELHPRHK